MGGRNKLAATVYTLVMVALLVTPTVMISGSLIESSQNIAEDIKEKDFKQVENCDAFFAWIPKDVTMIGTIREFDKALRDGKYTIILCYRPNPFLEDADELYLSYQDFLEGKQFEWK